MSERKEHTERERKQAARPLKMGGAELLRELYQFLHSLATLFVVLILCFVLVFRLSVVQGPSMENTLLEGDALLVRALFYTPAQGDIVIITKEEFRSESIVKRVIATEGQRVDIDYAAGTVSVDGVPLREDYIKEVMRGPQYADEVNHVTVPEGHIYVLGDNRNSSLDSRYPTIGLVDTRCVIGQAVLVLFPFSQIGLL